jgi:hypothetical protein
MGGYHALATISHMRGCCNLYGRIWWKTRMKMMHMQHWTKESNNNTHNLFAEGVLTYIYQTFLTCAVVAIHGRW